MPPRTRSVHRPVPIPVRDILRGLRRDISHHQVDPRELLDCHNAEFFQQRLMQARGYAPYENTTRNFGMTIQAVVRFEKYDGTATDLVIGNNDAASAAYTRTGVGVWSDTSLAVPAIHGLAPPNIDWTVANDELIITNKVRGTWRWPGPPDATGFTQIAGAPGADSITAYSHRPFLFSINEGGVNYPQRLRWPDIGTNTAWGITGGSEAGYLDVADTPDAGVCVEVLGNNIVLYKERSIHVGTYVGPPYVISQQRVVSNVGPTGRRGIADLGTEHVFLGPDAFYVFNGVSVKPFGKAVSEEVLREMDMARKAEVIAWYLPMWEQVHFIVPLSSGGLRDYIFHYSLPGDVWTKRDLPATSVGTLRSSIEQAWSDGPTTPGEGAWQNDPGFWGDRALTFASGRPVFGTANGWLYELGNSLSFHGAPVPSWIRFGAVGTGDDPVYTDSTKRVDGVDFWFEEAVDAQVTIKMGRLIRLGEKFDYSRHSSAAGIMSSDRTRRMRVHGRLFSAGFDANLLNNTWSLSGYTLWLLPTGDRSERAR